MPTVYKKPAPIEVSIVTGATVTKSQQGELLASPGDFFVTGATLENYTPNYMQGLLNWDFPPDVLPYFAKFAHIWRRRYDARECFQNIPENEIRRAGEFITQLEAINKKATS